MLDTTDEILLEQFITYNFMSMDTRDLCVHLIRNIREIKSSNFVAHKYDNNSFNIVGLSLERSELGRTVKFGGTVANGNEIRFINGTIQRKDNKYFVETYFYRANEYVDEDECDLKTLDTFTLFDDHTVRETKYLNYPNSYRSHNSFTEQIEPFDDMELYDYYYDMVHPKQMVPKKTVE